MSLWGQSYVLNKYRIMSAQGVSVYGRKCAINKQRRNCNFFISFTIDPKIAISILEQISNARVFNFKYFSSDISYQAYFSYVNV